MSHNPSLLTNRQVASRMLSSSAFYATEVAKNLAMLGISNGVCLDFRNRIATVSTMALLQGEHDLMHSINRIEKADDDQLERIIELLAMLHSNRAHA